MRQMIWIVAVLVFLAHSATATATDHYFGDSQTVVGTGTWSWFPRRVSASLGTPYTVHAIAGSQAADQANPILSYSPAAGDRVFYWIGPNDVVQYNSDTAKQAVFQMAYTAELYWLGSNKTTLKNGTGCDESGTWAAQGLPWAVGRYTGQSGATCTTMFGGDTLIIGYQMQDGVSGRFKVIVDGTLKATADTTPPGTILTITPAINSPYNCCAPAIVRLTGMGAGLHVVTLQNDLNQPFFPDWIWRGPSGIPIYAMTPARMTAAAYLSYGSHVWSGSDALVTTYVNIQKAAIIAARADGINVTLVDTNDIIDPATDLMADGVHCADPCQQKVGNALWSAIHP